MSSQTESCTVDGSATVNISVQLTEFVNRVLELKPGTRSCSLTETKTRFDKVINKMEYSFIQVERGLASSPPTGCVVMYNELKKVQNELEKVQNSIMETAWKQEQNVCKKINDEIDSRLSALREFEGVDPNGSMDDYFLAMVKRIVPNNPKFSKYKFEDIVRMAEYTGMANDRWDDVIRNSLNLDFDSLQVLFDKEFVKDLINELENRLGNSKSNRLGNYSKTEIIDALKRKMSNPKI
jgi:hypothetical protein